MKKEFAICRACPISRRCHTELTPTVMNDESNGAEPALPDAEINPWECLSFTCKSDGATAARDKAAHGPFAPYELVELDDSVHTEKAALFASQTKPLKNRVVTPDGRIYSKGWDGRFYRAHKIMS